MATGRDKLKALAEKADKISKDNHEVELSIKAVVQRQVIENLDIAEEQVNDKEIVVDDIVVHTVQVEVEKVKQESVLEDTTELSFYDLMTQLDRFLQTDAVLLPYHLRMHRDILKHNKWIMYHRAKTNRSATIYENGLIIFYRTSIKRILSRRLPEGSQLREFMKGYLYND